MSEHKVGRRIAFNSWTMLFWVICCTFLLADEVIAAGRAFQMTLSFRENPPRTDVDLDWWAFFDNDQPKNGLSIMEINLNRFNDVSKATLDQYDWTRIAAVMIDEPYWDALNSAVGVSNTNPCNSDVQKQVIVALGNQISNIAQLVRNESPKTRFWVNFYQSELDWMMNPECAVGKLNDTYIDVISFDKYGLDVTSSLIQTNLSWLIANRAKSSQQLALVPGTFHMSTDTDPDTVNIAATRLQEFIDYASSADKQCNLPLDANVGATGLSDQCPVWLVAGWPGHNSGDYLGIYDSSSVPIYATWIHTYYCLRSDSPCAAFVSSTFPVSSAN